MSLQDLALMYETRQAFCSYGVRSRALRLWGIAMIVSSVVGCVGGTKNSCAPNVPQERATIQGRERVHLNMTEDRVEQILGRSDAMDLYGDGYHDSLFAAHRISVSFDRNGRVIGLRATGD